MRGVTGAAARQGAAHIALRYARVLLYLEDRAALDALVAAGEAAYELGEEVFGPGCGQVHLDRAADGAQAATTTERPRQPKHELDMGLRRHNTAGTASAVSCLNT